MQISFFSIHTFSIFFAFTCVTPSKIRCTHTHTRMKQFSMKYFFSGGSRLALHAGHSHYSSFAIFDCDIYAKDWTIDTLRVYIEHWISFVFFNCVFNFKRWMGTRSNWRWTKKVYEMQKSNKKQKRFVWSTSTLLISNNCEHMWRMAKRLSKMCSEYVSEKGE